MLAPCYLPLMFRKVLSSILLIVSARGVDYPGVTKVIQVGVPTSRDIYIHRIGRTGRAGKEGEAVLVLAPFEEGFLRDLKDIPIKDHELPESEIELGKREATVFEVAKKVLPQGMLEETFLSLLGFCNIPFVLLTNGRSA